MIEYDQFNQWRNNYLYKKIAELNDYYVALFNSCDCSIRVFCGLFYLCIGGSNALPMEVEICNTLTNKHSYIFVLLYRTVALLATMPLIALYCKNNKILK